MAKWWLEQKTDVARAVHEAEESTGHQIVVHVGNLGRHPKRAANKIARSWQDASLVFCVDPKHRHFEIRWSQNVTFNPDDVTNAVREPLRLHDLAAAVTALAKYLPKQNPGAELPDIVDDSEQ